MFKSNLETSVRLNTLVAEEQARVVPVVGHGGNQNPDLSLRNSMVAAPDKSQGSMGGHQNPGLAVAVVCSSNMNRQAKQHPVSLKVEDNYKDKTSETC